MGYSLDWLSFAGISKDEVFTRLGIVDGGVPADFPKRRGFMWAVTPQGRVIVVAEYGRLAPDRLAELSASASLVAASAEDNDCTSTAWGYQDGRQIWSVTHDDGLDVEGEAPSEFAAIRDRLVAEQNASDDDRVAYLFDAPNELAATLGGWAPESRMGADLQFFSAVSVGGSNDRLPRRGVSKLWIGLAVLLLVVVAFRIWAA